MTDKLALIAPEIVLFCATCVVMLVGLSPSSAVRKSCPWFAALGLVLAGGLAVPSPDATAALFPQLSAFAKPLIAIVGLLLLLLAGGVVDRDEDDAAAENGLGFDALKSNRAEFYAFFLFSLTGLMLTVSADDLIWLFLALELTSLPTYVMVTISTRRSASQEAGVKYFFLGALGAATFLYGFALLYGAAGTTDLGEIAAVFREQASSDEGLNAIALAGVIVSVLGVGFKIAAAPMHFYAADVYQGAAASVSAFLAFVPKAAGFVALMLLLATVGWSHWDGAALPSPVYELVWAMAAATMVVGNTLALLQRSVKRVLAYSSVAHSGYMLVGLVVGPGSGDSFWSDGLAAVLFYLLCYGVMNVGAFAVLAAAERSRGEDIDDIDDLRGLHQASPLLAAVMLISSLSLLGLPPLLGFFGKLGLFTAAISGGEFGLAILLGLNSAVAALYYLRLAVAAYLDPRDEAARARVETEAPASAQIPAQIPAQISAPLPGRTLAGVLSAGGAVSLVVAAQLLITASHDAAELERPAGMFDNSSTRHETAPSQSHDRADELAAREGRAPAGG